MFSDNKLISGVVTKVEELLPPGWSLRTAGGRIRFASPNGGSGALDLTIRARLEPRNVEELTGHGGLLVVAAYLSDRTRELLDDASLSYADVTGNIRIVLDTPGLFITSPGASSNPWPDKRRLTLRGTKAGRIVCALAQAQLPLGVRELAKLSDTDPGYISRTLAMLDAEAMVERVARGRVCSVDRSALLARWAEDAPLSSRARATTWIAPRGLKRMLEDLSDAPFPFAITGSAAADRMATVAPTRLLTIYVQDAEVAAQGLELRATDAGVNVVLLEPEDDAIIEQAESEEGRFYASRPVVIADLLCGTGREPEEATALLNWLAEDEDRWHG